MKINVHADMSRVIMKLGKIKADLRDKVIVAALNKTVAKAQAEMVRQITAEFNIKSSDVRAKLDIDKASWKRGRMVATLKAFGSKRGRRSMNVIHFAAKQVPGNGPPKRVRAQFPDGRWRTITVREGGGVSVKIKRGGGRKLIKGAFIANQGRTVFMRVGPSRLKIKAVHTVDVPQMFNMRKVNGAVVRKVRQEFPIEFARALKMYRAV